MTIKNVCQRLKQARVKNGFSSARTFAIKNNIPDSTYTQHESGKRKMSIEILFGYCSILQVDPCWVITGDSSLSNEKPAFPSLPLYKDWNKSPRDKLKMPVNLAVLVKIILKLVNTTMARPSSTNIDINVCYIIYNSVVNSSFNNLEEEQLIIEKLIASMPSSTAG